MLPHSESNTIDSIKWTADRKLSVKEQYTKNTELK